jgi:hypothetical protein
MTTTVLIVLLATSISLNIFLFAHKKRTWKALERELSSRRRAVEKSLEEQKNKALAEIERLTNQQIAERQSATDKLLSDYKQLKTKEIELQIKELQEQMEFNFLSKISESQAVLSELELAIEALRRTEEAVIESRRRDALQNEAYHLNISEDDKNEINEIRSIATKYPRIRPILLKAVFDIYYMPEIKALTSRVIGSDQVSGIYRITNRIDGRVYIGTSVDIRKRWITHFKRAAGVETETQNLLYPAMRTHGLENFDFEILEEVENDRLNEREKYWQEFYKAKDFGLSVR